MIKHNGFLLAQIPEDYCHLIIQDGWVVDNWQDEEFIPVAQLPPGNYQIIGLAKDLSEQQWEDIVDDPLSECEGAPELFYAYKYSQNEWPYIYDTATQSGSSLLRSHSLEPNQTLILKEVEK